MSLIGGLSLIELKTMHEEEIRVVMEDWSQLKMDLAFKYLQARGCRSDGIDSRIDAALRAEIKEGNSR